MYITKVSGHRQATMAIQGALRQMNPDISVPTINGFGYTYPRLEKIVNRAYMGMIKRTPKVWDFLYDNPKLVKRSSPIQRWLHKSSHAKLEKLFEKHNPDAVICTQAFPCGMVADYKRTHQKKVALFAVLTDYAPHSFWINEGVDYYIVPDADVKDRFIRKGVKPDAIKTYGIPIRVRFAQQLDKGPIAEKLGIDLNLPVLLVMGGGHGLGPILQVVNSLLNISTPLQLIVLAGTNKILNQRLMQIRAPAEKKLQVFSYVSNVDELMEVASLIITKPGGLTTSEALAKGLPMVIVDPLPGQEMRNTDFLLEKGIGIRVDQTGDVGEEVELLLKSPERLAAMRKAAYEHAKPHASYDIARLILDYQGHV
jgi:processive 1,2-diacylglycerol beta-glucosyltransferase